MAIDQAIRSGQFVRNKCLRLRQDRQAKSRADLSRHYAPLASEFEFANNLNSAARQAHSECAWKAIERFYSNCKKRIRPLSLLAHTPAGAGAGAERFKPVGYPKYQKSARSVEYRTCGWKLLDPKHARFTDKNGIGVLRLVGTYDLGRVIPAQPDEDTSSSMPTRVWSVLLAFYSREQIKRVRIVRRADGYYVQFAIGVDRRKPQSPAGTNIGLDVGLENFYTDQNGHKESNRRFLRKGTAKLRQLNLLATCPSRRVCQKFQSGRTRAPTGTGLEHLRTLLEMSTTTQFWMWNPPSTRWRYPIRTTDKGMEHPTGTSNSPRASLSKQEGRIPVLLVWGVSRLD